MIVSQIVSRYEPYDQCERSIAGRGCLIMSCIHNALSHATIPSAYVTVI